MASWRLVSWVHFKHFRKPRYDSLFNITHIDLVTQQVFHRRYLFPVAGYDQIKETQVCVYVKREAVCGHPAGNVHSDSGDLSPRGVHAGEAFEPESLNVKIPERAD